MKSTPAFKLLYLVILAIAVFCNHSIGFASPTPSTIVWDAPFKKILTVQESKIDKGKLKAATTGGATISIPYTRVDVVIRNGIAFTRLLQIYHNHGTKNEGYAFSLPTTLDTHISQFNIWDRGERYVGAIEERTKAEDTYRSITGDETPAMNVDPGLVRKTLNRFEMRVFPIYPGEFKQIELMTHERIELKGDSLTLKLPLEALLTSSDARHKNIASAKTEITVRIADDLPIEKVVFEGHRPKEVKRGAHLSNHTLLLNAQNIADLVVAYQLKTPTTPSVAQMTFEENGEQFFALRLIKPIDPAELKSRMEEAGKEARELHKYIGAIEGTDPIVVPKASTPPTYFAVWRNPVENKSQNELQVFDLEFAGHRTFTRLSSKGFFHASWLAGDLEGRGKKADSLLTVTTDQPYPNTLWMLPLSRGMQEARRAISANKGSGTKERQKKTMTFDQHFEKVLGHLDTAIKKDQTKRAFLFLDELGKSRFDILAKRIKKASEVIFLLVTKESILPQSMHDLTNVSIFSLRDGWIVNRHFHEKKNLLTSSEEQQMFAGIGVPLHTSILQELWNRLPDIDPQTPQWQTEGDIQLSSVYYTNANHFGAMRGFQNGRIRNEESSQSLLWLVGRYTGSGSGTIRLQYPYTNLPMMGGFGAMASMPTDSLEVAVDLTEAADGLRFVGSFVGSAQAAEIDAKIRSRSGRNRFLSDEKKDPKTEKELKELRKEIVALSRRFSFISNETAFIALPEKLRNEHGIEAQRYEMGQLYGSPNDIHAEAVPEPGTILLLATALTGLLLMYLHSPHRHRRSYVQHTSFYR